MHYPSYSFRQSLTVSEFFFESIGVKGVIQKLVSFTPTGVEHIYNLALADFNTLTGKFDDRSISDNGDTIKILATIFQIVNQYLEQFPERWIVFSGNSMARNRLYRMSINHSFQELSELFSLFGFQNDEWEVFQPNRSYEFFLVQKK
ncbi:DUF6934 family protein [Larkinella sp.]|uniref:DUF6934 family protein n=1 Tax=Larkinella sp. TaxID=2034517 RepID=UPI003BAAF22C